MAGADSCSRKSDAEVDTYLWWNFMEIPLRHFLFRRGHNYILEPKSDGQWFQTKHGKTQFSTRPAMFEANLFQYNTMVN